MRLLWSGTALDRLRLWTGLVLFAFVATHLLNHAVGLWSLEAMTTVQHWRLAVTRSPPGFVVLTASLLTHAGLALWKLARLRTLRLRRAEVLQGLSGLVIPYLLMNHLFEAGVGPRSLGVAAAYPAILPLLWPAKLSGQTLLIIVVWLHGCLGLHYWLRGENWYRAASHVLAALAALIPAAALAGFVVAGREAARLAAADPTGRAAIESAAGISAATRVAMEAHAADAKVAFYGLVALTVAILALRLFAVRRPAEFPVVYAGGPTVRSAVGPTLLEISRTNRVPHLSVCGGKARCSTCRVRIVERGEGLAPPAEAEQRLLRRIGAPPDVRLACQIRPNGPLMVALLLKPTAQFLTPSLASGFEAAGVDREAAVLFVDIRGFTRLSQAKLAYDVVHILNSFFAGVGQAIEAAGGRVDKYIGDGLMAVFEHPSGLPGAARAAVEAVVAIDDALGGRQSPARGRNRRAAPARDGPARRPAGDRADRLGRGGAADGHRAGGQHREQAREPGEGEKRRTRRFARMRDRGRTFAGGARCRRGRHSRAGGAVPRPAGGGGADSRRQRPAWRRNRARLVEGDVRGTRHGLIGRCRGREGSMVRCEQPHVLASMLGGDRDCVGDRTEQDGTGAKPGAALRWANCASTRRSSGRLQFRGSYLDAGARRTCPDHSIVVEASRRRSDRASVHWRWHRSARGSSGANAMVPNTDRQGAGPVANEPWTCGASRERRRFIEGIFNGAMKALGTTHRVDAG